MKGILLVWLLSGLAACAAVTNIHQHPQTVSGIAVEGGIVVTVCSDGYARVFDPNGTLQIVGRIGPGVNAVAFRRFFAFDTGESILHEGVAITESGDVVRGTNFPAEHVLDISRSGTWGVATDQHAYNRFSGLRFRCVPETAGFDKWPMGVEELSDGSVVVVALDGVARVFAPDGTLLRQWRVSLNGLCAVDVDAADRLAISSYPVDYPVDARAPSMVNLYSPDGQLQAQCALNSLAHSVQFDQGSVLIGTHTGEFLRWDGDPGDAQAAPTTAVTKPKRGKGK